MSIGFQEFLRRKSAGSDLKERREKCQEWLGALDRLFRQIEAWLVEADPENLIEIIRYKVQRVEKQLGIFDAPGMTIRVGISEVKVLPNGRFDIGPMYRTLQWLADVRGSDGLAAGRVDITDGARKYVLIRSINEGQDAWYAASDQSGLMPFDRTALETILLDLLG